MQHLRTIAGVVLEIPCEASCFHLIGNWNIEPRSCRHQNNQRDKTLTTQFALSKTLLPRICQIPNEEVEFPGGRVSPALPAAGFQGRVRGHLAEVAALESYGTRWQEHKSIFLLLTLSLLRCIEILECSLFPHSVTQHELTHILNYFWYHVDTLGGLISPLLLEEDESTNKVPSLLSIHTGVG